MLFFDERVYFPWFTGRNDLGKVHKTSKTTDSIFHWMNNKFSGTLAYESTDAKIILKKSVVDFLEKGPLF